MYKFNTQQLFNFIFTFYVKGIDKLQSVLLHSYGLASKYVNFGIVLSVDLKNACQVPSFFIRKLITQVFSFINISLFNRYVVVFLPLRL